MRSKWRLKCMWKTVPGTGRSASSMGMAAASFLAVIPASSDWQAFCRLDPHGQQDVNDVYKAVTIFVPRPPLPG